MFTPGVLFQKMTTTAVAESPLKTAWTILPDPESNAKNILYTNANMHEKIAKNMPASASGDERPCISDPIPAVADIHCMQTNASGSATARVLDLPAPARYVSKESTTAITPTIIQSSGKAESVESDRDEKSTCEVYA